MILPYLCHLGWEKHEDSPLIKQIIALRDDIIASEGTEQAAIQKLNQWSINGELQSKLAYDHFRPRGNNLKWPKIIWNSNAIPKQAFIFWLGMKGRLLTKERLHDPNLEKTCSLCRAEDESIDHLFFQCLFVRQVWSKVKNWLGFHRSLTTLKAAVKWVIKEARGTGFQEKMKKLALASTTYFLWEARNLIIFEGKIQSPETVFRKIQISVYGVLNYLLPDFTGI